MTVGTLGTITFEVSPEVVTTFNNLSWNGTANYGQHQVHGGKAVPEYMGRNSDTITFEMILSAFLGVTPKAQIDKLSGMLKSGIAYPLVLGTDVYGKWHVSGLSSTFGLVYKDGALITAKVKATLLEAGEGV